MAVAGLVLSPIRMASRRFAKALVSQIMSQYNPGDSVSASLPVEKLIELVEAMRLSAVEFHPEGCDTRDLLRHNALLTRHLPILISCNRASHGGSQNTIFRESWMNWLEIAQRDRRPPGLANKS